MEKVEKFRIKYKVIASDMDVVYRMTPNAMLMYFQDCFANYLSGKCLAAFDIADKNLIWMITRWVGHETPCVKRISEEISRSEADCFHK